MNCLSPALFKNYSTKITRQVASDAIVRIAQSILLNAIEKTSSVLTILGYHILTFNDLDLLMAHVQGTVGGPVVEPLLKKAAVKLAQPKIVSPFSTQPAWGVKTVGEKKQRDPN